MTEASKAVEQLAGRIDKALVTVLATKSADERRFIFEAAIGFVAGLILNRYAGAYLDKLGLKALAENHAEATLAALEHLRGNSPLTPADQEQQLTQLQQALQEMRAHGASAEAEKAAAEAIEQMLIEAGAMRAQAQETAREVTVIMRAAVQNA